MTRPLVTFYDVISQEEITREMNDEEYKIHLAHLAEVEKRKKEIDDLEVKKANAEAKLALLGLTSEDLKALGLG